MQFFLKNLTNLRILVGHQSTELGVNSSDEQDSPVNALANHLTVSEDLEDSDMKATKNHNLCPLPQKENMILSSRSRLTPISVSSIDCVKILILCILIPTWHLSVDSISLSFMVINQLSLGLATYGTVARGLSQNLLDNDHTRIKSYETKFIGHVFPGETLKVKVWIDGDKRYFEVETV